MHRITMTAPIRWNIVKISDNKKNAKNAVTMGIGETKTDALEISI